jgi:hypothetical protein
MEPLMETVLSESITATLAGVFVDPNTMPVGSSFLSGCGKRWLES